MRSEERKMEERSLLGLEEVDPGGQLDLGPDQARQVRDHERVLGGRKREEEVGGQHSR